MGETSGPEPAPASTAEKGRWRIVTLCAIAMGLAFMDRGILPLFVHQVETDLRLTDVQFSLLTGLAFTMFFALCGIPIGRLVDTRSRPKIIGFGMLIWSTATMLTGFGRSFLHVFIARMAVGVGESSVAPASQSMSTDMFLDDNLARAMSTVSIGVTVGMGSALLFGGAIAWLVGPSVQVPLLGVMHAWRIVFLVLGAPGLILAPIMIFTVKDPKRRRLALKADGSKAASSYLGMLRFVWAHRTTIAYNTCGYAFFALGSAALATWAPAHFIRHFHKSEATIGLTMGLLQLVGGTLCLLVAGWWIDRKLRSHQSDGAMQFSRNLAALALIPMLAFPFMPTFALSVCMVIVAGTLMSGGYATSSISHTPLIPNQMRAQFSATFLVFANIMGGMVGPTLVAFVNKALFHDPNKIGVAAALVGGASLFLAVTLLTIGLRHYRRSMQVVVSTTAD